MSEEVKSILTDEQLEELNPEHIEHNIVVDDITEQDLFNEDDILALSEGEAENVVEVAAEEVAETEGE